ncbi:ABC transporter permease [Schaalia cardiffensis]|uniref:ABC transporter permease n=1 Tax=Schaalia cardiffensis TaxID=181487 RepID=UPI0023F3EB9E|nr:ABC transporter permease [Schaalia cardiffensis]
MLTVFRYEATALLRDRALLGWTLAFSLILSLMFMVMFQNLGRGLSPEPVAFGIVEDEAYDSAPGLSTLIDAASTPDGRGEPNAQGETMPHIINPIVYPTRALAEAGAESGEISGYLAIVEREPHIYVTAAGKETNAVHILRAALNTYVQRIAELESLALAGVPGETIVELVMSESDFTSAFQPTSNALDPSARYYMALLGFSCGMGVMVSMTSVRRILATTSALGARRTLAALPRGQVLAAVIAGAWACMFVSMLIAYHFIRWVVGADLGPHILPAHLVIAVSTLMACSLGALFGSFPALQLGTVSGISSLLSLFTGLYGSFSADLEAMIRHKAPYAAALNPLWQIMQSFYSLLYYDSFAPFFLSVGTMTAMSVFFFIIALLRLLRMSHAHL